MFRFTRKRNALVKRYNNVPFIRHINDELTDPEGYSAAGVVFTDGKHMLAGYQPGKKRPHISGIGGGKDESDKSYIHTAIREMIEELFDISEVPLPLIHDIERHILPTRFIQSGSYIMAIYRLSDIQLILRLVKRHKLISPIYDKIPTTLDDLIFKRKIPEDRVPEITHLAILPVVLHPHELPFVDPHVVQDMGKLLS
jgi:hypothetical protein